MVTTKKNQYKILAFVLVLVVAATVKLNFSNSLIFERFIGNLNPLITILFSAILGFLLLYLLLSKEWFSIYQKKNHSALLRYAGIVLLFVSVAIYVDLKIGFPADMNILFPESLLFYPVIAFFVEILFHVLPLLVLLFVTTFILKKVPYNKLLWVSIFIVAMLEPTYQAIYMDSNPTWAIVVIWINLYSFNITQLIVFKRYDFISMFALRLVYYLFWHIIWGSMRLELIYNN